MTHFPPTLDLRARLEGGLLGLLVGDAVGVPYEFMSAAALPALEKLGHGLPTGFHRAHPGAPPAAWSDDGAQALCLLSSLLDRGRLDPDDLVGRLVDWYQRGYMAVEAQVFDVGLQTERTLLAVAAGKPWSQAVRRDDPSTNGNGSLMRVLPLALWHRGSDAELCADARLQSRVTHGHLRAQLCCALYCLWARRLLAGSQHAYDEACLRLYELVAHEPAAASELDQHVRPRERLVGRGSGYVVDTLHSAREALEQPSYERVVQRAIAFGDDTDTTAAVAGGLAGIRHGAAAIPGAWALHPEGLRMVAPLLSALHALRA
jgi:ADP-ribosyl-[dinitrogen reductase] hydrolase